jgi:hypothetical protein
MNVRVDNRPTNTAVGINEYIINFNGRQLKQFADYNELRDKYFLNININTHSMQGILDPGP